MRYCQICEKTYSDNEDLYCELCGSLLTDRPFYELPMSNVSTKQIFVNSFYKFKTIIIFFLLLGITIFSFFAFGYNAMIIVLPIYLPGIALFGVYLDKNIFYPTKKLIKISLVIFVALLIISIPLYFVTGPIAFIIIIISTAEPIGFLITRRNRNIKLERVSVEKSEKALFRLINKQNL